jgi:hypothetical protein
LRFLIDGMLPHQVANQLNDLGHDAISPVSLGLPTMLDAGLIEIATSDRRVIVTENIKDFAAVTSCTVLLVRKYWWPNEALAARIVGAVDRWANANPEPAFWARWLDVEFR